MTLAPAELDTARAAMAATLDGTCSSTRPSRTRTPSGGYTEAQVASLPAGTPCRVTSPSFGAEQRLAERLQVDQALVVVLAWDADVAVGDVLTLHTGDVAEVAALSGPQTWNKSTRALCRVEPGG